MRFWCIACSQMMFPPCRIRRITRTRQVSLTRICRKPFVNCRAASTVIRSRRRSVFNCRRCCGKISSRLRRLKSWRQASAAIRGRFHCTGRCWSICCHRNKPTKPNDCSRVFPPTHCRRPKKSCSTVAFNCSAKRGKTPMPHCSARWPGRSPILLCNNERRCCWLCAVQNPETRQRLWMRSEPSWRGLRIRLPVVWAWLPHGSSPDEKTWPSPSIDSCWTCRESPRSSPIC